MARGATTPGLRATFTKSNNWQVPKKKGANVPPLEFNGGNPTDLKVTLMFDTYESGEDVRKKYTNAIWNLAMVNAQKKDPKTKKGQPLPDGDLREQESVPLPPRTPTWDEADVGAAKRLADADHRAAVDAYVAEEVLPWVPDAWVDHTKTRIGYEIPLTRHFYTYTPPRPVAEIDAEIKALEAEIRALLDEVTE